MEQGAGWAGRGEAMRAYGPRVRALLDVGRLSLLLRREAEYGRFFLWAPVLVAAGILVYFALPVEPAAWLGVAGAALAFTGSILLRGRREAHVLLALSLVLVGLSAAKLRTDLVAAPQLVSEIGPIRVEGVVERSEWREQGLRFVLRAESIGRLRPETAPRRVLVTWRGGEALPEVGERLSLLAMLRPPPGPTAPDAYHWRRALFFQGIGATGFSLGAPESLAPPERTTLASAIASLRHGVTNRVFAALPGQGGALAAALLTGERGRIASEVNEVLRYAGLAHILAISGMHMALFAGTLYLAVRFFLALVPRLALDFPIRKWAALVALAGAVFYLALSGASVSTQRAFVMITVMFVAILADRRALTMRNVAIAALLLLLWTPESILSAGFQMSFAATIALIATYESGGARLRNLLPAWKLPGLRWAAAYLLALFVTSTVAGLATGPYVHYHFYHTAPYGLLGNLMALPFFGTLVMPFGLLALVCMPFGLEAWPLLVMDRGIDLIVASARWVSDLQGAVILTPSISGAAVAFGTFAGLWLCLWIGPLRWLGLAGVAAASLAAVLAVERPDIVVADNGLTLGVRQADGRLAVTGLRHGRFAVARWLEGEADPRQPADASVDGVFSCDPRGCIAETASGRRVALVLDPAAFTEDCMLADIVVSALEPPAACAAETVGGHDLARGGAHSVIWPGGRDRPTIRAALSPQRPWDLPPFRLR